MSRISDLIAQAKAKEPALGADLEREFKALSSRLPFGLNFERHSPEAVELPQRPIRKGPSWSAVRGRTSQASGPCLVCGTSPPRLSPYRVCC